LDRASFSRCELLPKIHATGKLAREMETSDATRPIIEDQIIGVLREHEANVKMADLCRKRGISNAMFYNWKFEYDASAQQPKGGGAPAEFTNRPSHEHMRTEANLTAS
jgi:hypothetical protein